MKNEQNLSKRGTDKKCSSFCLLRNTKTICSHMKFLFSPLHFINQDVVISIPDWKYNMEEVMLS